MSYLFTDYKVRNITIVGTSICNIKANIQRSFPEFSSLLRLIFSHDFIFGGIFLRVKVYIAFIDGKNTS